MPNIVMADQPSGGQEIVKLAYGTYTKTSAGTSMAIPVSYSGTLLYFFCHETEEIRDYDYCPFCGARLEDENE